MRGTRCGAWGSRVELANVSFAYEDGVDVLRGVNLVAEEGSFTAIVGPSGGGKFTVARLVSRHWDVREGSVSVGGTDVRDMPPARAVMCDQARRLPQSESVAS